MIPEGISTGLATVEAVSSIMADPRSVEDMYAEVVGPSYPDDFVDLTYGRVVYFEHRPIVFVGFHVLTPECDLNKYVVYQAIATPEAHRWPLFFTRYGRSFVSWGMLQYPDHHHMTWSVPGSSSHHWLRLLGFSDTVQSIRNGRTIQEMVRR